MMKRILSISIILVMGLTANAINIGTYQSESEYGLLDGFKFNWNRKDKAEPLVEIREESTRAERDKEKKDIKENEYQYTKYMYEGKSVI